MPYVFGIDGGGSTSRAVLITDQGRVLYIGKGPGINYHEVGASHAANVIKRMFNDALEIAHATSDECKGVCLGLAGVSRDRDKNILTPLFDPIFGKDNYLLMSDADVALVSGTLSETGIIVISGTGSIIFGRNEDGEERRAGGYGPLISDEGSGYQVSVEALRAITYAYDGVGEETALTEKIIEKMRLKNVGDLIAWINSTHCTREKIAALAPVVIDAAEQNDPVAHSIIDRQADHLAKSVKAVHQRLEMEDRVDVVLAGGLFTHSSFLHQMVRRKILYLLPGLQVIAPKLEPVLGATFYAYSLAGIAINEDLISTIKSTYKELRQNKPFSEVEMEKKPQQQTPSSPQEEVNKPSSQSTT